MAQTRRAQRACAHRWHRQKCFHDRRRATPTYEVQGALAGERARQFTSACRSLEEAHGRPGCGDGDATVGDAARRHEPRRLHLAAIGARAADADQLPAAGAPPAVANSNSRRTDLPPARVRRASARTCTPPLCFIIKNRLPAAKLPSLFSCAAARLFHRLLTRRVIADVRVRSCLVFASLPQELQGRSIKSILEYVVLAGSSLSPYKSRCALVDLTLRMRGCHGACGLWRCAQNGLKHVKVPKFFPPPAE